MLKYFKDLKLHFKISILTFISVAFLAIICIIGLQELDRQDKNLKEMNESHLKPIFNLNDSLSSLRDIRLSVFLLTVESNENSRMIIEQESRNHESLMKKALDKFQTKALSDDEKAQIKRIEEAFKNYSKINDDIRTLSNNKKQQEAIFLATTDGSIAFQAVLDAYDSLTQMEQQMLWKFKLALKAL